MLNSPKERQGNRLKPPGMTFVQKAPKMLNFIAIQLQRLLLTKKKLRLLQMTLFLKQVCYWKFI